MPDASDHFVLGFSPCIIVSMVTTYTTTRMVNLPNQNVVIAVMLCITEKFTKHQWKESPVSVSLSVLSSYQ